jgi:hypothetical protein
MASKYIIKSKRKLMFSEELNEARQSLKRRKQGKMAVTLDTKEGKWPPLLTQKRKNGRHSWHKRGKMDATPGREQST